MADLRVYDSSGYMAVCPCSCKSHSLAKRITCIRGQPYNSIHTWWGDPLASSARLHACLQLTVNTIQAASGTTLRGATTQPESGITNSSDIINFCSRVRTIIFKIETYPYLSTGKHEGNKTHTSGNTVNPERNCTARRLFYCY